MRWVHGSLWQPPELGSDCKWPAGPLRLPQMSHVRACMCARLLLGIQPEMEELALLNRPLVVFESSIY